jgi:hypothetical protein
VARRFELSGREVNRPRSQPTPHEGEWMRILSRLPVRRAPMAAATAGAPAVRRERASEPVADRPPQRPIQLDELPAPLGPARGVALAIGLGALAWLFLIAILLRY